MTSTETKIPIIKFEDETLLELPPLLDEPTTAPLVKPKRTRSGEQGVLFKGHSNICANGALSTPFKRSMNEMVQMLDLKEAKYLRYALTKRFGAELKKSVTHTTESRRSQMKHLMNNLSIFKAKYPSIATEIKPVDPPPSPVKKKTKSKKKRRRVELENDAIDIASPSQKYIQT